MSTPVIVLLVILGLIALYFLYFWGWSRGYDEGQAMIKRNYVLIGKGYADGKPLEITLDGKPLQWIDEDKYFIPDVPSEYDKLRSN